MLPEPVRQRNHLPSQQSLRCYNSSASWRQLVRPLADLRVDGGVVDRRAVSFPTPLATPPRLGQQCAGADKPVSTNAPKAIRGTACRDWVAAMLPPDSGSSAAAPARMLPGGQTPYPDIRDRFPAPRKRTSVHVSSSAASKIEPFATYGLCGDMALPTCPVAAPATTTSGPHNASYPVDALLIPEPLAAKQHREALRRILQVV